VALSIGAGQDPPTPPRTRGLGTAGIKSISTRFPKPSNCQALATLAAVFDAGDIPTAEAAGWEHFTAQGWFLPDGILATMRLRACGWQSAGDKLRASDDHAWWDAPYDGALYVPLTTYVKTHPTADAEFTFTEQLALGDPNALETELHNVQADLDIITEAFSDVCRPYLVPIRAGIQPQLDVPCAVAVSARRKADPNKLFPLPDLIRRGKQFSADALKLVAVAVLIYLLEEYG
jgi:hypothetical protein